MSNASQPTDGAAKITATPFTTGVNLPAGQDQDKAILDMAEDIIHTELLKQQTSIPISQLASALSEHVTFSSESDITLTFRLTESSLVEFLNTPLGKLWIILTIKVNPLTSSFVLRNIRDLRTILSKLKTLADAAKLNETKIGETKIHEDPRPSA